MPRHGAGATPPKAFCTHLDFVWLDELCVGVDIVDILVSQCDPVAPVQRADVVVHRRLHGLPVVFHCGHSQTAVSGIAGTTSRTYRRARL